MKIKLIVHFSDSDQATLFIWEHFANAVEDPRRRAGVPIDWHCPWKHLPECPSLHYGATKVCKKEQSALIVSF